MPVIGSGTQLEHQVQEAPQVLLSLVAVSSRQSFQLRPSSLTADALEPTEQGSIPAPASRAEGAGWSVLLLFPC